MGQRSYTAAYRSDAVKLPKELGASVAAQQLKIPADTLEPLKGRPIMGRIEISTIKIPYTGNNRTLRVYLPNVYDDTNASFPVLYMHDGQNVFTDRSAFGEHSWGVAETLENLVANSELTPFIVVGVDSEDSRRFEDYSPWKNSFATVGIQLGGRGGDGEQYAEFFSHTLKSYIDSKYRTLTTFEHTGIAGSSMGGVISAYLAASRPHIYGKVGVFSPASWFCSEAFDKYIKNATPVCEQKFFISVGSDETSDTSNSEMPQIYIDCALQYAQNLMLSGVLHNNISLKIYAGAKHNEAHWAKQVPDMFKFLFQ